MEWKYICTGNIACIEPLVGDASWYWGTDDSCGDLYEAEALFQRNKRNEPNRLIFIKYPEGDIYEPIKAKVGQYMGRPISYKDRIYCLLVDFMNNEIIIYQIQKEMQKVDVYKVINLDDVIDCYNVMLAIDPLMLIRQGHENVFQIIWPIQVSFPIENTETFMYRDEDFLIFSKWYEDPDYREEVIVRNLSGDIIETINGSLKEMPNGKKWILK